MEFYRRFPFGPARDDLNTGRLVQMWSTKKVDFDNFVMIRRPKDVVEKTLTHDDLRIIAAITRTQVILKNGK